MPVKPLAAGLTAGLVAGSVALIASAAAASAQTLPGQVLLIPDSGADNIGAYSPVDGSLLRADFIADAASAATYDFNTPKEATQVGNEIWVSDQLNDFIAVFDLAGGYQATIRDLDNIRGFAEVGETVYVASGGTGTPVLTLSASGRSVTGSFARDGLNPFDVVVGADGNLLVSDIENDNGGEGVLRFAPDGTFLGQPVAADTSDATAGPDFPQQIAPTADGGFLVAGLQPPGRRLRVRRRRHVPGPVRRRPRSARRVRAVQRQLPLHHRRRHLRAGPADRHQHARRPRQPIHRPGQRPRTRRHRRAGPARPSRAAPAAVGTPWRG